MGKTSLALEVGHRLYHHFPGGVAFVSLSQLDDPGLLLDNIAHALGLRESTGRSLREVLKAALRDRQLLIILDNFEHLTQAATDVAELLAMCPRVQVLVTSRSPLRIRGERELPVRPLAVPDPKQPPAVNSLVDVPSVQLFVQRAEAVSPTFQLTEANADTVAAICRRLDGLPLAIELAAARIRFLSPTALLSKLDQLLPVLTGGPKDLPARQQTVRASVAWSYDLLEESEQKLFRGISVFAGGWTIEGAEAVAPELDILSDLGQLVEASLVVQEPDGDRYRMLEPVREFAAGELVECGESHGVRDRHAAYYIALAEEAELGLKGQGQLHWLQRLDKEHDNLRTALTWLLSRAREGIAESGESIQRLTAVLSRFWFLRGHWSEGRGWLNDALSVNTGDQSAARAKALDGVGLIAQFQNDYQRATAYLEESLALYRNLGDQNGVASALTKLGFLAAFQNDRTRVDELHTAIAPMEPYLEDKSTIGYLLIFLGLAAVIRGEIEKGIDFHDQPSSIFRQLADVHGMVWCLTNMGLLKMVTGDLLAATAVLQEDLGLAIQLGEPASIQYALLGLATVASQEGRPECAARLWGAAEAIRGAAGMELNPLARAQTMYDTWVDHARNEAGAESFAKVWAEGSAMSLEQTLSYALSPAE